MTVDPYTEKPRWCHVDRSGDISYTVIIENSRSSLLHHFTRQHRRPCIEIIFFHLSSFSNRENNKKAREHKMPSCTKQQNNGIGIKLIAVFY